ncbi:MAG: hypothetical protein M3Z85_16545, partial [Acidobacteriota bacterium]|nr:hypothetical protein [Acidobacteriota bacterium]
AGRNPRGRFSGLQIVTGGEYYLGDGLTGPNGEIVLRLTSDDKQLRLTGTLVGNGTLHETP